ncbi:hypothetical protein C0583_04545 [Candidatus Parcubacteria bacterium]|nr:MAG: hypothetical protein C0583_04545 [Candidatus Parcubacteria bacterium]
MIEYIFYVAIFLCFLGLLYVAYEGYKNRNYYSLKNIWARMIEERESSSIGSLLLKTLGVKMPNVTSRKFDAIFFLILLLGMLIFSVFILIASLIEKML